MLDGVKVVIDIIDPSEPEEYTPLEESYLWGAQGFLLVYDITNRHSMEELQSFFKRIQEIKQTAEGQEIPCVVIGNKMDLEAHRQVHKSEGEAWAKQLHGNTAFLETSAKTGQNVEEAFLAAARAVIRLVPPPSSSSRTPEDRCVLM